MIFDTHAHYDDEAFDGDREELLSGLAAGGIGTVVNVGADMESTKTTIALTEKYPDVYKRQVFGRRIHIKWPFSKNICHVKEMIVLILKIQILKCKRNGRKETI